MHILQFWSSCNLTYNGPCKTPRQKNKYVMSVSTIFGLALEFPISMDWHWSFQYPWTSHHSVQYRWTQSNGGQVSRTQIIFHTHVIGKSSASLWKVITEGSVGSGKTGHSYAMMLFLINYIWQNKTKRLCFDDGDEQDKIENVTKCLP